MRNRTPLRTAYQIRSSIGGNHLYRVPFHSYAHLVRPNELRIQGPVPEGMSVVVLVNHDPGWRAEQDGRPVPIEATKLGVILVRARTSAQSRITLRYRGTLEPRAWAAVSGLVWLLAIGALFRRRREARELTS